MCFKNFQIVVLFLFCGLVNAQTIQSSKRIKGKINSESFDLGSVTIKNKTKGVFSSSQNEGDFSIEVSVGDTLSFSAVQFVKKEKVISKADFDEEYIIVKLEVRVNQIEEVEIDKNRINVVDLGIVTKAPKKYTQAERKINEATTGGGFIPLNPILNAISGRTKMLKKALKVEIKEATILRVEGFFDSNYFKEKLKIPEENIEAFKFFIVEDIGFTNAMKDKNKSMASFLLIDLASKYLELIKEK